MHADLRKRPPAEKTKDSFIVFIRRVKRILIILTSSSLLFIFFGIFQPLRTALESSLIDNFARVSYISDQSILSSIQRGVEGAKSLSSRTMIRTAISDYQKGSISLEELMDYTQPKYEDGCGAIEYLVSARRFVGGTVIASYETADNPDIAASYDSGPETLSGVSVQILFHGGGTYAEIVSPILADNVPLGYDSLLYVLTDQVRALSTDRIEVLLVDAADYQDRTADAALIRNVGDISIYESQDRAVYFASARILDDAYFITTQSRTALFIPSTQLAVRIFVLSGLICIGYIMFAYFYMIRFVREEFGSLEHSRDMFMNMAYIDHLTKAHSRRFLEIWNKTIRSPRISYTVAIIDIDNFKSINDTGGHETGDKVLKLFASVILAAIRQSDYLIRYGGDEFVVLFHDMTCDEAKLLLLRMEDKLADDAAFPFQVSFSYGTCVLSGSDNFEKALNTADKMMYEDKNQKKSQ
jgi:diguanylate cyclase (GGDEF)-like protein